METVITLRYEFKTRRNIFLPFKAISCTLSFLKQLLVALRQICFLLNRFPKLRTISCFSRIRIFLFRSSFKIDSRSNDHLVVCWSQCLPLQTQTIPFNHNICTIESLKRSRMRSSPMRVAVLIALDFSPRTWCKIVAIRFEDRVKLDEQSSGTVPIASCPHDRFTFHFLRCPCHASLVSTFLQRSMFSTTFDRIPPFTNLLSRSIDEFIRPRAIIDP